MIDYQKIRRDLHQIPEIGLEEYKTHAYLMRIIDELTAGLDFVEIRIWRTGILVFVKGSTPAKTIGWRTDIDGLPIVEETGFAFASQHEGRMHACGHDMHMTIALGLLEKLTTEQPKNNLLFLFQPAEENEAGGMLMYEDGAFGDWLPDEFYGLHVRPDLKVGDIATNTSTLFAMTGEDFGYLLSKVKGVMFWLGIDSPYALHHPKMAPDEAALPFAIEKFGKFLSAKVNE